MTELDALELFEVIKKDEINSFRKNLEKYKKLLCFSFGRFSLLSTCYLFSSKKILRAYENDMLSLDEKTVIYEPFEIYNTFKAKSGKAIRLFAGKSEEVSSFEMLAVLDKTRKLKKLCKKHANLINEKEKQNIIKIYKLKGQKASFKGERLVISHKKMTIHQKKIFASICACLLLVVMIGSIFAGILININGIGTKDNPKKIYSTKQLEELKDKGDIYVRLMKNLTFSASLEDFCGVIYGDGHTLQMQNCNLTSIFENFSGTLENVKLSYKDLDKTISASTSLLVKTNTGTLKNISLTLSGMVNIDSESAVYLSLLASNNYGNIENCSATVNAQILSNNNSSFFSVFATSNSGKISGCCVLENSTINCTNTSLSAIVAQNNSSGEISSCTNYAEMSLLGNIGNYTSALSGISLTNYGEISDCINSGALQLSDTSNETLDVTYNSYVGGVCVQNYKNITHCKNSANITIQTANKGIYSGGIIAHGKKYYLLYSSQILNCAVNCNINATKEQDDTECYVGGIAGYFEGRIADSYSLATFTQGYDESRKYIVGMAVGKTELKRDIFGQYYVDLSTSNVLCLSVENVSLPLASPSAAEVSGLDITECSRSEIENSDIYW